MREDMQKRKSQAATKKKGGDVDIEIIGVSQNDIDKLAYESQESNPRI